MVSKYSFRQELIKFIQSIEWSNPFALTLTLKQRVFNHSLDLIQVTSTIRHFMNRLNRMIFGNASKRYNKKLKLFPVIEHGADKRFHIHAIIDCPNKITTDQFNFDFIHDLHSKLLSNNINSVFIIFALRYGS